MGHQLKVLDDAYKAHVLNKKVEKRIRNRKLANILLLPSAMHTERLKLVQLRIHHHVLQLLTNIVCLSQILIFPYLDPSRYRMKDYLLNNTFSLFREVIFSPDYVPLCITFRLSVLNSSVMHLKALYLIYQNCLRKKLLAVVHISFFQ